MVDLVHRIIALKFAYQNAATGGYMNSHRLYVPSTVDAVCDALSSDVFSLFFIPGTKVSETTLAARYGVSRNTIREAISILVQAGILVKVPNRGIYVKLVSFSDVNEIFHLRLMFETEALSRICRAGYVSPQIIEALRRMELSDLYEDWAEYVISDSLFHSAIVNAAGSERLSRMYNTIASEVRLCISQSREILEEQRDGAGDHRLITHYIQEKKEEDAVACLTMHLQHAVNRFEHAFSKRETKYNSTNIMRM